MKWNYATQMIGISLIAAVLLSIVGWAYNYVVNASITWGAVLGLGAAALLLWWAMKINKGKESLIEWLPKVLIVMAIIDAIAVLWPGAPFHFTIEITSMSLANVLSGIGLAFGTVFLANTFMSKIMKKA